jgi:hypothetical protein
MTNPYRPDGSWHYGFSIIAGIPHRQGYVRPGFLFGSWFPGMTEAITNCLPESRYGLGGFKFRILFMQIANC